jgi:hypothetical protein
MQGLPLRLPGSMLIRERQSMPLKARPRPRRVNDVHMLDRIHLERRWPR